MMDQHDFLKLDQVVIDSFERLIKPYPDDKDLRKAYLEMKKWDQYKLNITASVHSDYNNRKK